MRGNIELKYFRGLFDKIVIKQLCIASPRTGVPNRGPSGPPGGHGTLKGDHGYEIEFWGAMEDFRGATTQQVNF